MEWPAPFSKTLRERAIIEGVIHRFIAPLQATTGQPVPLRK
jgi:hypothetical protein